MASTLLNTIANFETTLSSKLTVAGASLTLTTNLDKQGNAIPSGVYGFTIDEGKSNEEHVLGTLSGSTLTITTRNVSVQNGTTAGTGKEHRKGASIKITNHPLLVRMRRILDGTDGFNGASPIQYDSAPTFTPGSNQLVSVAYADSLVAGGVADATNSSKGKVKLSVAAVDVAQPIAAGDNDPRIPTQDENDALVGTSGTPSTSNKFVTNDDISNTSVASKVVRANASGLIDRLFLKNSYLHYISAADTTLSNTSETTAFTRTISTGELIANSGLRVKFAATVINSSGASRTLTMRIKYGGTTVATLTYTGTNANGDLIGEADIMLSTLSTQVIFTKLFHSMLSPFVTQDYDTAAVDMSASASLTLTAQRSSDVNFNVTIKAISIEVLK